jgi:TFIIF-interacting CTD phosphatase-like protein
LSKIGRDAKDAILIDNSPDAYMLQPEQAIPVTSWYDDENDTELFDLIPVLMKLSKVPDVRIAIPQFVSDYQVDFNLANQVTSQLISNEESSLQ